MLKTIWGPKYWFVLHASSYEYPQHPTNEDKKHMKNFIECLANLTLPCHVCRDHMKDYLKKNNIDEALESNDKLIKYLWNFHNHVNNTRGKPEMSFHKFEEMMKDYGAKKNTNKKETIQSTTEYSTNPYLILFVVMSIVMTYYILKRV